MNRNRLYIIFAVIVSCLILTGCGFLGKQDAGEYHDRTMYELKGEVKNVNWYFNNFGVEELGFRLEFDSDGKATRNRFDDTWEDVETDISITRDDKNRITSYIITGKEDKATKLKAEYQYNENGQVFEINSNWYNDISAVDILEYDNDRNLVKQVSDGISMDIHTKETIVYEYTAKDENGNWTERKGFKTTELIEDGNPVTIDEGVVIERREIEYY